MDSFVLLRYGHSKCFFRCRQVGCQLDDSILQPSDHRLEGGKISANTMVLVAPVSHLLFGSVEICGLTGSDSHNLIEFCAVPSIRVLSSCCLHNCFVLASYVTKSKGKLIGKCRFECVGSEIKGEQGFNFLFVHCLHKND